MSNQEKIVCQGVNFVIRDFNECCEGDDNGFTYHAPFILSNDEMSVSCTRGAIIDDIEGGENWEIIREDIGFITSKNRFVDAKEAMDIALKSNQLTDVDDLALLVAKELSLGNTSTAKRLKSELAKKVGSYLSRNLTPEDLLK